MQHADEFRRCLTDLDVVGVRKIWAHICPHLPQPVTRDDALYSMHLARTKMDKLHPMQKHYSELWLKERMVGRIACSVGLSVLAPRRRKTQAEDIRGAMTEAVTDSIKAGIDIDTEAPEVKHRIITARDKYWKR